MKLYNEELAAQILEAGKQEFLKYGFQNASMRRLAASIGVTTGAIYRYYQNKAVLFEDIVKGPAQTLFNVYRDVHLDNDKKNVNEQLQDLPDSLDKWKPWMMNFLYDNYDVFKLITCCSTGTKYENYFDSLIDIEVKSTVKLMKAIELSEQHQTHIDEELIHMLAGSLFFGICETIRHNMPREKAVEYFIGLSDFYTAGWYKLLGINN